MAHFLSLLGTSSPTSFFTSLRRGVIPKARDLAPAAFCGRFICSCVHFNASMTAELTAEKERRSANYKPPNWDYELLQSLENECEGETYIERSTVLKEQVEMMLDEELKPLYQLELIDEFQRVGISYHFNDKINFILRKIYMENKSNYFKPNRNEEGLYETALEFRLLRQHDFHVPQEVFDGFRCKNGDFKASLSEDTKGLLYLYEASFFLTENESTLELARGFAAKNLKKYLEEKRNDEELTALVRHALELPLHWRMQRLEARWFIDVYEKRSYMNPTIHEFAKLDFNIVQATHRMDLQYISRWWKATDFSRKYTFARDRLVENLFWTIGVIFYPQYGYCRRMSTKVNALVTTIDDIYELELFTDAVERWNIKAIDQLPDYIKRCYITFYNSINEMAYNARKEQECHTISYLSKARADLCRAYMKEAKWYSSGYTPTLEAYLNNAWISISAPLILVHAYFLVGSPIKEEALECLDRYHNIIRCSFIILRLSNDLGTSLDEIERGDVPKSIQCYMAETNASEQEAREHIKLLISETWREMNKERVRESPFSKIFIEMAMNLARMSQCVYQNGDGHGHQDSMTLERISALLLDPINLSKT